MSKPCDSLFRTEAEPELWHQGWSPDSGIKPLSENDGMNSLFDPGV